MLADGQPCRRVHEAICKDGCFKGYCAQGLYCDTGTISPYDGDGTCQPFLDDFEPRVSVFECKSSICVMCEAHGNQKVCVTDFADCL